MVNDDDLIWMQCALELARHAASQGEVPVGAIVVADNQVVAEGWNQPILSHDPTAHAEIVALRQAGQALRNYRLINTTLYVTLEPCTMCFGAMVHARIQRVVFGAYDVKSGIITSAAALPELPLFNHRFSWEGGVLAESCGALLSQFFKGRRSSPYSC
ncbi:MAG: tRNA-specific adenosine deaminase [Halothiobacillaceae bacterium]|nr:MAG: tRNA-specific adenosine deaminase [Halothiobacillaceae bacterium]